MADVRTDVEGMKTIEASTRIDLDTPVVNLNESAEIAGKGTGATGILIKEPRTSSVTVDVTPVYIQVEIGGVAHYIAAYPEAE